MQRLILMRHAEAERAAASGRDRDRALSAHGQAEARAIGRSLSARGARPDVALISAAVRTRQTWELAHEALGDADVRVQEPLYNAGAEVLRQAVEDARDDAGCLIVVAHNPGVHQLAREYLVEASASPAALDRMAGGFPTAAAALVAVDASGRLVFDGFLQPRDVSAA